MTGPATYARCADTAAVARDRLDRAAASAAAVEEAQRTLVADLLALWPTSAWIAAGATSAKRWLLAYTHCSAGEAHRLERVAGLCHRHPRLASDGFQADLGIAMAQDEAACGVDQFLGAGLDFRRLRASGGFDGRHCFILCFAHGKDSSANQNETQPFHFLTSAYCWQIMR